MTTGPRGRGRPGLHGSAHVPRRRPASGAPAPGPGAWDAFVAAAPVGSFPQLTAWAEANAAKGWRARRIVADSAGRPIGAQLLIHHLRPGPCSRAYAPRGPVASVLDGRPRRLHARGPGGGGGRAPGPRDHRSGARAGGPFEGWLRDAAGSQPAIQINRTRMIDLAGTEAELWADLRSSARWSVTRHAGPGTS